jgi:hypothetical protein
MREPKKRFDHVSPSRLLAGAVSDHLSFTDDEFNHLKQCTVCFEQWKQFIHDHFRDNKRNKEQH